MLKQMRGWFHRLKFMLWFVVAGFIFTIFAVWGGARDAARPGGGAQWAARINGEDIPSATFYQRARNIDSFYRQLYGTGYAQQRAMLRIGDTVVRDLIDNRLVVEESGRMGLTATAADLTRRITNMPEFKGPDGRFIGRERYLTLLRTNGLDVANFEAEQLEAIIVSRFKNTVFNSVGVSERELMDEIRRHHLKTRVAVMSVPLSELEPKEAAAESELQQHLQSYADRFERGETRRGTFLILAREGVEAEIEVPEADVRRRYERDRDSAYTRTEQRRSSHILFKIEAAASEDEVEKVRAEAEKVLAQARSGADFAELARNHSEDTGSAAQGGDLGFFGRGAMVREFELEAFRLPVGEISDLVRSSFGFHIIKVTGTQPAGLVPFEEARGVIELTFKFERVQSEMTRRARVWAERLRAGDEMEEIASEESLELQDTGFLTPGERGGGATVAMVDTLFVLEPGASSEPIPVPEGLAVVTLREVRPPTTPPLEEVRKQVEADWKRERALSLGRQRLEEAGCYGDPPPEPAVVARAISGTSTDLGPFARSSFPAELPAALRGSSFDTPAGGWSQPVLDGETFTVLKVLERPLLDEDTIASTRDGLKRSLLFEKRNRLYTQILQRLRDQASIEINRPLIEQIDRR
ncbi:MAG: peptidylprolyl isomerase [Acidobacteriota bacterium]